MGVVFISGSPCSEDELYHYGILGQKWGVRRFQNEDRTWTAAGKLRYGAEKTASALGKAAKATGRAAGHAAAKTGKHVLDRVKSRHPWMMSDQELQDRTRRVYAERSYQQAMRDMRKGSPFQKGFEFTGKILERGATTLSDAAFRKLADRMMKSRTERQNEKLANLVRKEELTNKLKKNEWEDVEKENTLMEKQLRNKELKEKLNGTKVSDFERALKILDSPRDYKASDIKDANEIIKNVSSGRGIVKNLLKSDGDTPYDAILSSPYIFDLDFDNI